ncbi:MAG: hypothetical protein HZA61_08805 [Candidatus Eisenbacteria bacterium]|uniref:T9SS type A sorting domain-containing protein n=1 Tax=Eiseniibacteriota bacterium TaxID=2212470 RepID=A0A933W361_UNCEI|nr:hypothetical protein [Candidatus Eisenbacteria bacterium]
MFAALSFACLAAIPTSASALTLRDSSFVTDGAVLTMKSTGSTLFVGGSFTRIGPFTGSAVVLPTADPKPGFPRLNIPYYWNSQVLCAASDSTGGWFLGGSFVLAQGQPHVRMLHVRADGTLADWAPAPNGNVNAMTFAGGRLYVTGAFTQIGGESRNGVAAIDTGTAAAFAWNPVPATGTVRDFLLANGKLYAYGSFRSMNGEPRAAIAAFDPASGALLPDVPSGPDRQASGQLLSLAANSDRLFLSGDFSYLSPPTGSFARLDTVSGNPTSPFEDVVGTVRTIVPDGNGGWFFGGSVTNARGQARTNLLHVNADGTLAPWTPSPNGEVRALALCGDTLFVGGAFTYCDGQFRPYLAAYQASTGVLLSAPPAPSSVVHALVRSGDRLFVGGAFTTMGGTSRYGLASLDWRRMLLSAQQPWGCGNGVNALTASATALYAGGIIGAITPVSSGFMHADTAGTITYTEPLGISGTGQAVVSDGAGGWYVGGSFAAPGVSVTSNLLHVRADETLGPLAPDVNGTILALLRSGTTLYLGGTFTSVNGSPRAGLAAIDVTTGALLPFDAALSSGASVRALTLLGDSLYVGGAFTAAGGQPRASAACVQAATGSLFAWDPQLSRTGGTPSVRKFVHSGGVLWTAGRFSHAAGQPRGNVAALDAVTAAPGAWTVDVITAQETTVEVLGNTVFVGGDFATVNGQPVSNLVALDATTGIKLPTWSAQPNGAVRVLQLHGGTLYLGGEFDFVNAAMRMRVAALNASTGTLLGWAPVANTFVYSIARDGNRVAMAGAFGTGNSITVHNAVGFSLASGRPNGFAPNVDGEVTALGTADGVVYVGGSFVTINAVTRVRLGAVAENGTLTSWASHSPALVYALTPYGSRLYVGGEINGKGSIRAISRVTGSAATWNPAPSGPIFALNAGSSLTAGGNCVGFGGASRSLLGSVTIATGAPTTWAPVINSPPTALLWNNGTLFAGGSFTTIASASHRYLAAWNTSTNALLPFDPVPDGAVSTLALGSDTLFTGGAFSNIAGSPRLRLAAFSASSLALLGVDPGVNGNVAVLEADRGRMLVAGAFTSVGMSARGGLAAVDLRTGYVRPWDPRTFGNVDDLHLSNGRVYAVGTFFRTEAPVRNLAAAFDTATAEVSPWAPEPDGTVFSMAEHEGTFYLGGAFSSAGGAARTSLAQVDTTAGLATAWNPGTNGTPIRLAVDSGTLFVGGAFTSAGGQPRGNGAAFDATTGVLTSWNPSANNQITSFAFQPGELFVGGAFTSIGGASRPKLALLSRTTGLATAWNAGMSSGVSEQVDVLDLNNGLLFVGGTFGSVANGAYGSFNLALLDAPTGAPIAWRPDPWQGVHALLRDRGTLHVGGFFSTIASEGHPFYAALLDPSYQLELLDAPAEPAVTAFTLGAPTPNPARNRSRLAFTLPAAGAVRLGLFDVTGRRVAALLSGERLEAGRHEHTVDVSRQAPGLYWYRLEYGGRILVRSVTVRP